MNRAAWPWDSHLFSEMRQPSLCSPILRLQEPAVHLPTQMASFAIRDQKTHVQLVSVASVILSEDPINPTSRG